MNENTLTDLKQQGPTIPMTRGERIAGLCFAPFYLILFNLFLQHLNARFYLELTDAQLNLAYYFLCAVSALLLFRGFLQENLRKLLEKPGRAALAVVIGLAGYYALLLVLSALVQLILLASKTDYFNRNNAALTVIFANRPDLLALIALVLAPITEECLFRGLIYCNLSKKGHILAVLATAVCFSAIHVVPYLREMTLLQAAISTVVYFPAAIVLCEVYRRTDSIFCAMLTHTCINLISLLGISITG